MRCRILRIGYIPFDQDAANLFFQLVPSRYEHASLIMTSNLPFARWGDVFGDLRIASAMIDRIVYHADVISLKGRQLPTQATPTRRNYGTLEPHESGPVFSWQKWHHFRSASTAPIAKSRTTEPDLF